MQLLIADDHALFREGLSMIIEGLFPNGCIHQNSSWEEAHQTIQLYQFDLVLLDIFMPRQQSWEEELSSLVQQYPTLPICIISASSEKEHIQTVFNMGVKGYICKIAEVTEITTALLKISQGGNYFPPHISDDKNQHYPLTLRQQEILNLMAIGKCNKLIARQLYLTENTVKRHIYNICQILNTHNRVEAIEIARKQGLLPNYSNENYGEH